MTSGDEAYISLLLQNPETVKSYYKPLVQLYRICHHVLLIANLPDFTFEEHIYRYLLGIHVYYQNSLQSSREGNIIASLCRVFCS